MSQELPYVRHLIANAVCETLNSHGMTVEQAQFLPDGRISCLLEDGRSVRISITIDGQVSQDATTLMEQPPKNVQNS